MLDVTIVCEAPRVGPHRDAMRARIAAIAGVCDDRVAVKATTSEKLGFAGRGEGIVAISDGHGAAAVERRMIEDELLKELHTSAKRLLDLCRKRGLRIATAESCTGGFCRRGAD